MDEIRMSMGFKTGVNRSLGPEFDHQYSENGVDTIAFCRDQYQPGDQLEFQTKEADFQSHLVHQSRRNSVGLGSWR